MIRVGILAVAGQGHGGTLLYTLSMIEALRRLAPEGYACSLYVPGLNSEYDRLGLPMERLPSSWRVLGNALIGKRPLDDVDVVIAPVYSLALLACRRPYAFTLHDLQERHLPENFGLATRLWRHMVNRLLTWHATRIVCESTFVQRDITRFFGVTAERIDIIPAPPFTTLNGEQIGAPDVDRMRRKFGLPAKYALYPAQFWPHKNHFRLVQAFARVLPRHPDCKLVLTGKKRDEFERVFRLVHRLGLESKVLHIGYVESDELAALYRGATVAVIPTLFESISIPVYEAFSIGTAVCASSVVALPEQIGDAGLLFDPRSIDDIAAALDRLLGDGELRRQLIERGRLRMQSVTHDDYAARLRRLIDAMAGI